MYYIYPKFQNLGYYIYSLNKPIEVISKGILNCIYVMQP